MKLPKKTQAGFSAKGRRKAPPGPGGGAAARAYQWNLQHGVETPSGSTTSKNTTATLKKKIGGPKS